MTVGIRYFCCQAGISHSIFNRQEKNEQKTYFILLKNYEQSTIVLYFAQILQILDTLRQEAQKNTIFSETILFQTN